MNQKPLFFVLAGTTHNRSWQPCKQSATFSVDTYDSVDSASQLFLHIGRSTYINM